MVFNQTPIVTTRAHGGPNDKVPSNLGSLSASGITAPTALAGCNGNETVLLTGNREEIMKGNYKMTRTGNVTVQTRGNEDLHLTGTRTDKVDTDLKQRISGNAIIVVIGDSRMTYTGHQVVDYKSELHVTEWQARWHKLMEVFHNEVARVDTFTTMYIIAAPTSVSAFGANVDIRLNNIELIATYADFKGIRLHDSAEDLESRKLKQNFKTLDSYFYCVTQALGPAVMVEADAILHTLGLGPNLPPGL